MKSTMLTSLIVFGLSYAICAEPAIAVHSLDAADGNPTYAVYVDNEGRLGIGTTTPDTQLHVKHSDPPGKWSLTLENSSPQSHAAISFKPNSTEQAYIYVNVNGATVYNTNGGGMYFRSNGQDKMIILDNGNVGIGTTTPRAPLDVVGRIRISDSAGASLVELGEGLDYAEGFELSNKANVVPGTVLVIDAEHPGKLSVSNKAYDRKVAGVVPGAKGLGSGVRLGGSEFDCDVALAGRVFCNVDATELAVEPGDLLTTSITPGYAMKASDYARAQGAILGKAMERLAKGKKRQILILVTLQ